MDVTVEHETLNFQIIWIIGLQKIRNLLLSVINVIFIFKEVKKLFQKIITLGGKTLNLGIIRKQLVKYIIFKIHYS